MRMQLIDPDSERARRLAHRLAEDWGWPAPTRATLRGNISYLLLPEEADPQPGKPWQILIQERRPGALPSPAMGDAEETTQATRKIRAEAGEALILPTLQSLTRDRQSGAREEFEAMLAELAKPIKPSDSPPPVVDSLSETPHQQHPAVSAKPVRKWKSGSQTGSRARRGGGWRPKR